MPSLLALLLRGGKRSTPAHPVPPAERHSCIAKRAACQERGPLATQPSPLGPRPSPRDLLLFHLFPPRRTLIVSPFSRRARTLPASHRSAAAPTRRQEWPRP